MGKIRALIALFGIAAVAGACTSSQEDEVAMHTAQIGDFCVDCHNDADFTAGLSLQDMQLGAIAEHPQIWESVVRKLRGGMMPPADEPRPDPETYAALVEFIEAELDAAHELYVPSPGIHRLNRQEYANAIRDLLGLEVDASDFLPADDSSRGFDNQAGSLSLSPALLEAYLTAAGKISRTAIGHVSAPTQVLYRVPEDTTQDYHVEGLPLGTRGGLLVEHYFPVDAQYTIKVFAVNLGNMGNFRPFGEVEGEQLEVLLDGERIALVDWDEALGGRSGQLQTIDVRVPVQAGQHELGVTYLATNFAPLLDLNKAFERSTIETGGLPGFTFYPHIGSVRIDGPYEAAGVSQTTSREKIFSCHPADGADEAACAERIVRQLARRAYRGLDDEADIETLLDFYALGREQGNFEAGIEMATQRLLTDPKFIYRFETVPEDIEPGEIFALDDLELASRLSFFLWSSIPDDRLLDLAGQGRLSDPEILSAEVDRMIADPRSMAFTENFAGQWLSLRNLDGHAPVVNQFPDFDDNLRQAFRREMELLFDSILREDRSVLDLLTADYTFVNERLARHYGIPGVQGSLFRRVDLAALGEEFEVRYGLIGKGSALTVASQPGRTAPVMRGAWIMGQVIGIPAPDPPADVPPLVESEADAAGNTQSPTIREQYQTHTVNPVCQSCHKLMDPFGFALENFDATGRWREDYPGQRTIDTQAKMYDGTPVSGPSDVRNFLVKYSDQFVRNVVEKMMTYALGRGTEYFDMPVVRSIVRESADDNYRFDTLIRALVLSEPFRMSMRSPDPGAQVVRASTIAGRQ